MKRLHVVVFLFLLFVMFQSAVTVVKANKEVYIRSDGSVEGTDKIQRDGNVYTLTDDLSATIYVQKKGIVLDGAGYTLDGDGQRYGIDLSNDRRLDSSRQQMENVVVKNFRITNFQIAINLKCADNCSIIGNYMNQFSTGITMIDGDFLIKHNTIENDFKGATLSSPSYVGQYKGNKNITENNFYNFSLSIVLPVELYFDSNYWSSCDAPDENMDGIRDIPYVVYERDDKMMGTFEFVDEHPLTNPVEAAPVIPEFQAWIVLPLLVTGVLATLFCKKKLEQA